MTLKEFRKSRSLTQQQAGEAIGVTKQRFGQIEKAWPEVDHTTIEKVVDCLGAMIRITPGEEKAKWSIVGVDPNFQTE